MRIPYDVRARDLQALYCNLNHLISRKLREPLTALPSFEPANPILPTNLPTL